MKSSNFSRLAIVILMAFIISSCTKDEDETVTLNKQIEQFNDDSNFIKSESDQIDSDVNDAIREIPAFGRGANVQSSALCGATIDSSQLAQKIIFINFDGITPCFSPSRTRDGQIKVQLTSGNFWSDINSVLTITYINFKVTRLFDNKSITLNGVKTLTNINGNNWLGFFLSTSTLKYKSASLNISVLFDDGSTTMWNANRTTEWAYDAAGAGGIAQIDFSSNGDTTLNGYSNVDSWGINRFGDPFTSYYSTPWLSNTYCGLFRPVSGQLTHNVVNSNFTITLGVDQNGNPASGLCAYGFKVDWTFNGNSYNSIFSY